MQQAVEQHDQSTDALDTAEAEAWAALEKDVSGEEGDAGGGEGQPEPAADNDTGSEPEQPAAKAEGKDAGDEPTKPDPESLARQYQAAMREERESRKKLQAELDEIKSVIQQARDQRRQAEEQPPSLDEDPVGYFEHQNRTLAEKQAAFEEQYQSERQQREQEQQSQQFMASVAQDEQAFAAKTPDYWDAADHLRNTRMQQLSAIYPDTPEADAFAQQQGIRSAAALREAILQQEVMQYSASAYQTGRTPAAVFYDLARQAGYTPKQAQAAAKQVAPQQKAQMARAASERAQSLSGGGGGQGRSDNASIDELAELFVTDPDAADALFEKLAASGQLG